MSACDGGSPCGAGFDCVDTFCIPSQAAAIARNEALSPSSYDCPSHAALATGCDADLPSARTIEGAARDACGQTWFSTASYTGQRDTFDPLSGELVGATAFSQGPSLRRVAATGSAPARRGSARAVSRAGVKHSPMTPRAPA